MAKSRLGEAAGSKLTRRQEEREETQEEGMPPLVSRRPMHRMPTSMRLRSADIDRLQRLTEGLSDAAGRPLHRTDVLRGLLLLGERSDRRKLLDAIKDALFEMP